MSGRILLFIRDDARRAALRTVLESGYFEPVEATDAAAAQRLALARRPALALLDAGPEGLALCRSLKSDQRLGALAVMMAHVAGAPPSPAARLEAEAAGADCAEAPLHKRVLLARIRCLIRLKMLSDELDRRRNTARELGLAGARPFPAAYARASILIVAPPGAASAAAGLSAALAQRMDAAYRIADCGFSALRAAAAKAPDALLVVDPFAIAGGPAATGAPDASPLDAVPDGGAAAGSLAESLAESLVEDPVDMIAAFAAREETRRAAILYLTAPHAGAPEAPGAIAAALDAGASDYADLTDPAEIAARLRVHVGRKRQADNLRAALDEGLRLAARDSLTGLYDRRYFDQHAARLFADKNARPLTSMIFDIDHFKSVNDAHGHAAGDAVLKAFADRLRALLRRGDLICRYGGEEFAVLSPGSTLAETAAAADRVRLALAAEPVRVRPGVEIAVTVSVGVAAVAAEDGVVADLIARADAALYAAKREGRNRVSRQAA